MEQGVVMNESSRSAEVAKAANAALASLLKTLVDKEVLSNSEVRALLARAARDIGPHEITAPTKGAAGIIFDDLLPRFPEDGGD
jgi:hypothetical protein